MKSLIFTLFISFSCLVSFSQSVSINEDGSAPNKSSMLDVKSTTKGMLIPRMTTAQRTGISNPGQGLLVFDNETASFWFYKASGWTELVTGGSATNFWNKNGVDISNNNTGNVGIGLTNPTSKLTIKTPINSTGFTHIGGPDSIVLAEAIGGISAAIGTSTNHAFRLTAGTGGRVNIYPTGEVVVGTGTTPSFGRLTVETPNNSYGISHTSTEGNVLATRIGGTSAGIGTFSNTNMRIFSNGVSAMFISSGTNNVGIGIDFPNYKLEVNGTIRCKEVIVEAINWPDYVFGSKYKLQPLEQVEKYIIENKHLPNIPSAEEMDHKGVHMADTQKLMMEKIEELTLYMIEANKKIEKLERLLEEKK